MTPSSVQWPGDAEPKPAPAPLIRVQALVNTVERPHGADRLATVADATPWLVANGLVDGGSQPDAADLLLLRTMREALRALLIHNSGGPAPPADALSALRDLAAAAVVRPALDNDGAVSLASAGVSVAQRLAVLLLIIRDAQHDGSWARLKVCANDECRWAFYDRSRNRGGAWCEMAECGNKLKNRQFRARKRTAAR